MWWKFLLIFIGYIGLLALVNDLFVRWEKKLMGNKIEIEYALRDIATRTENKKDKQIILQAAILIEKVREYNERIKENERNDK